MDGWIKLHRKILDNPIVCKDSDHIAVWTYLLLNATHKEYPTVFKGIKIILQPGQLITGRKVIAEKFNISESKVQRILKSFEIEQQIEQQNGNKNRLVSILSWIDYQDSEQQNEHLVNNKRTTTEQQVNTNKNVKNDKNVEKVKKKDIIPKIKFAEFVSMTQEEYDKLLEAHGQDKLNRIIETLDNYKGSTGKKYTSDYRAILNWVVTRVEEDERKLTLVRGGGNGGKYQAGYAGVSEASRKAASRGAETFIGSPGRESGLTTEEVQRIASNFD